MSTGHVKQEPLLYEDPVEGKESVFDKKNEPTVSNPKMYLKPLIDFFFFSVVLPC